jgi:hypothetical protein
MEFDRRDEETFWTPEDLEESEQTVEGIVDWFPIADEFPQVLWCLHYPDRDTYTCRAIPGDPESYGMVTFSTLERTERFIEQLTSRKPDTAGCIPVLRTFDEARELAKDRDGVQALILLDDPRNPSVHYVRAASE